MLPRIKVYLIMIKQQQQQQHVDSLMVKPLSLILFCAMLGRIWRRPACLGQRQRLKQADHAVGDPATVPGPGAGAHRTGTGHMRVGSGILTLRLALMLTMLGDTCGRSGKRVQVELNSSAAQS